MPKGWKEVKQQALPNAASAGLTTEELAAALSVKQDTLRKRLCQTGSYFGLRPKKLPNGKLRWPADSVEALVCKGSAK